MKNSQPDDIKRRRVNRPRFKLDLARVRAEKKAMIKAKKKAIFDLAVELMTCNDIMKINTHLITLVRATWLEASYEAKNFPWSIPLYHEDKTYTREDINNATDDCCCEVANQLEWCLKRRAEELL